MALLAVLAACGGTDPADEIAERRAMFEAVLRDVRAEMPGAEIVPRGGPEDAAWVESLRERGLVGPPRDAAASGWRVEIGWIETGQTPAGEVVVRTSQTVRHPGGRADHRIAYLLESGAGDRWRVRDARVEYVADYATEPEPRADSAP